MHRLDRDEACQLLLGLPQLLRERIDVERARVEVDWERILTSAVRWSLRFFIVSRRSLRPRVGYIRESIPVRTPLISDVRCLSTFVLMARM